MKYIILFLSLFVAPSLASAHGSMMFGDLQTGPQMMQYIEDQALGEDLHEEMEELMVNMMSGSLTQEDAARLTQLMDEHPGPYATMMNRIGAQNWMWGDGMMGGNWWFLWLWLIPLSGLIWIGIGILVIFWLWKQVQKK